MALQKLLVQENGLECNYWKISEMNITANHIYVILKGYLDKETRDKGVNLNLTQREFYLPLVKTEIIEEEEIKTVVDLDRNIYVVAYELCKDEEFFAEAQDI